MAETLIVTLIVLAAAAHLCRRLLPRHWLRRGASPADTGCATGCGSCGGCPSDGSRHDAAP